MLDSHPDLEEIKQGRVGDGRTELGGETDREKVSLRGWHLSKDLKKDKRKRKRYGQVGGGGRMGRASAMALGQQWACNIQRGLEQREQGKGGWWPGR